MTGKTFEILFSPPLHGRILRGSPYHHGPMEYAIDIQAKVGTQVQASADGKDVKLYREKNGELYMEVLHPNDTCTGYGHLSKFLARKGAHVKRGDVIALSGATGDLAGLGPHLHFEVTIDSKRFPDGYESIPFRWLT